MTEKSSEELLAILAQPDAWSSETVTAARVELEARGVKTGVSRPPDLPRPVAVHSQQLAAFPVIGLLVLHYLTLGLFSLIWINLMHGRINRIRPDDPSGGRAFGFCFIPFFNLYWIFFVSRRLCLRVDEQRELYDLPRSNLCGLATTACIIQVIPYINLLLGYTLFWPIYIGMMQSSVNQLVKKSATTPPKTTLQPVPGGAGGMSGGAIAAIVCGCVLASIFIIALLAAMLLPALAAAKKKAQLINCMNNEKQLAFALVMYADGHDGKLPPAATWCDAINSEITGGKAFKCPDANAASRSDYAFNARLDGVNVKTVDPQTVLVFESDGGWNASGGPEILSDPPRHRGYVVAFADGSVRTETAAQMQQLKWNP